MIKRGYRCNNEGSVIPICLHRFVYKHQCMSIDTGIKSRIKKKTKIVGTVTNSSRKNSNINAIGNVTSNFIGQLHLQIRVILRVTTFESESKYCFVVTHTLRIAR